MDTVTMQSRARIAGQLIEKSIPIVVLAILIVSTYAFFQWIPYYGISFSSNGYIRSIYALPSEFQPDDLIRQVGDVTWEDFKAHLRIPLLPGARPGDAVPFVIEREGALIQIDYVVPEPTALEFRDRVVNVWPVSFAFWAAGTLTLLLARPKDTTWRLLIAFNYLTALWLSAGVLSSSHLWESAVWLRVFIWVSLPVYLHLNLVFPTPLARLSRPVLLALYGLCGLLVIAQWLEWLPRDFYLLGFLAAIVGSVALLIIRYIIRPVERSAIGFMTRTVALAALPIVILVGYGIVTGITGPAGFSVLFLPGLPFAYAYAIYRRRLGGLEMRVNRAISIYSFCMAVGLIVIMLMPLIASTIGGSYDWLFPNLMVALTLMLVTAVGFGPFQQFVERRILGVRIPPTRLLESYAAEITTTLDTQQLIHYLRDDVAASLLIRQSALVQVEGQNLLPLYAHGISEQGLPTDPAALDGQVGCYLPPPDGSDEAGPHAWIRLILPLSIETRLIGYWLLGRRDPDDYYSTYDISILTTIANQTATALHNILQTQRLHALYQNDIDRSEAARANLARELHDQVLNELGLLWRTASQSEQSARMEESFQRLSASLRQTITGLRPAAVDFGLRLALADLVDRVGNNGSTPKVELALDDSPDNYQRHAASVELHLYRIVQQAVANALRHAQSKQIRIRGVLLPDVIELHIEDDGVGFEIGDDPDIAQLVARKHFGIASMFERAHLIGARIQIQSMPGQGTHIHVVWPQVLTLPAR